MYAAGPSGASIVRCRSALSKIRQNSPGRWGVMVGLTGPLELCFAPSSAVHRDLLRLFPRARHGHEGGQQVRVEMSE